MTQELYPLGELYHWDYDNNDSTHTEIIEYPYTITHNGYEYFTVHNFRYDGRIVGLRNDGLKVHILTGLNTTPVDCVLYDFEVEVGDFWTVYDVDEGFSYKMRLDSKNDTVVWYYPPIYPITSPCYVFSTDGDDWGYIEWISYYFDQMGEISGWAGIVKRINISYGGDTDWICTEFYTPLSIENDIVLDSYAILNVYPNPFNPTTTIRFNVGDAYMLPLRLDIFNITGRLVETLVSGELVAGEHEIVWNAGNLSSGVYFVQLVSGDFSQTQKVVLMK
ncbi:MAG: T9SS type A sorting domain-containing protein [Fidelibacterota bacterium]